eukprot:CAMPEP_0119089744 /NCGR_PEP_ID=MMETSP1178-20130426/150011_1 /TAXON_ID=33656 /ORGANISM="unid sp, Strain CCMP2000" /LENGTH=75 /DNA_ID=CAMNT_0007073119 /DNA_START=13 /DNA_END=237 /DNA_ORIENTATION=-
MGQWYDVPLSHAPQPNPHLNSAPISRVPHGPAGMVHASDCDVSPYRIRVAFSEVAISAVLDSVGQVRGGCLKLMW